MKKDIHPSYNTEVKVECVCGNKFTTGSVKEEFKLDVCSSCHPFYSGKQNLVDSAQRVKKFKDKMDAQKKISETRKGKKAKKIAQKEKQLKKEK